MQQDRFGHNGVVCQCIMLPGTGFTENLIFSHLSLKSKDDIFLIINA